MTQVDYFKKQLKSPVSQLAEKLRLIDGALMMWKRDILSNLAQISWLSEQSKAMHLVKAHNIDSFRCSTVSKK